MNFIIICTTGRAKNITRYERDIIFRVKQGQTLAHLIEKTFQCRVNHVIFFPYVVDETFVFSSILVIQGIGRISKVIRSISLVEVLKKEIKLK